MSYAAVPLPEVRERLCGFKQVGILSCCGGSFVSEHMMSAIPTRVSAISLVTSVQFLFDCL